MRYINDVIVFEHSLRFGRVLLNVMIQKSTYVGYDIVEFNMYSVFVGFVYSNRSRGYIKGSY